MNPALLLNKVDTLTLREFNAVAFRAIHKLKSYIRDLPGNDENQFFMQKFCLEPVHFLQTCLCAFQSARWHSTEQYLTA